LPEAVPPITVCHQETPVERLFVMVFAVRVRPVENVRGASIPVTFKVFQVRDK